MTEATASVDRPLWLAMEEQISGVAPADLEAAKLEQTVHRIADELDGAGYNVSRHGGNMLELRAAIEARAKVGRPLLGDFRSAIDGLTLDDLGNTHVAARSVALDLGEVWPRMRDVERRQDLLAMVEQRRLDLLVARAREMPGDRGIRFLIEQGIEPAMILEAFGIPQARYDEVHAAMEAEKAERTRIHKLLGAVAEAAEVDRARHLITNDVADADIVEVAGIPQEAVDAAREAMAAEIAEKQRLAEEAAAAKKAAAEGPSLDAIPPGEMLEHIEAIREIMEFSEDPDEIRTMCEQSNIPKSLVEVAVADPGKLDELESAAENA